jgi:hypothetical protein
MSPEHSQYLTDLDRGGWKSPTDFVVEAVIQMYLVFHALLTQAYESKDLAKTNQKSVLLCLFNERLKVSGELEGECICAIQISELLKPAQPTLANI